MAKPDTRQSAAHLTRKRQAEETMAVARGELWTVQIAYFTDLALARIQWGRWDESRDGKLSDIYPDAHMYLDPTVVLGDKLHARQQACKLANVDQLSIYVVGAPKAEKVEIPEGLGI